MRGSLDYIKGKGEGTRVRQEHDLEEAIKTFDTPWAAQHSLDWKLGYLDSISDHLTREIEAAHREQEELEMMHNIVIIEIKNREAEGDKTNG